MQVSMGKESRTTDMERIEKMTEHTIEHAIEYTSKDEGLIGNEKIEEAIAALQQEPNEALLAHALTVIRRRMREHGQVISGCGHAAGSESYAADDGRSGNPYADSGDADCGRKGMVGGIYRASGKNCAAQIR